MHRLIARSKTSYEHFNLPFTEPIKSIKCCENDFILILTTDNSLYIYGNENTYLFKRFILKTNEFNKINPEEFNNEKIKFIENSYQGFIIVTENNNVYVAGKNNHNQFGFSTYKFENVVKFTKLNRFITNEEEIKFIRCSYDLTFVVTNNNVIYGCGENEAGQFGLGHSEILNEFTKNDTLQKQNIEIKDLRCGDSHCIILDKIGNVYGCGSNTDCQIIPYKSFLENCNENDDIPREIKYFTKLNLQFKVKIIRCVAIHTVYLSTVGDIYFIGKIITIQYLKLNNVNNLIVTNIISDCYGDRTIYITKNKELYCNYHFLNPLMIEDDDIDYNVKSDKSEIIGENSKIALTNIMEDIKNSNYFNVLDSFGSDVYILLTNYFIDMEGDNENCKKTLFFSKLKNQLLCAKNNLKDITIILQS
ncbi:hypothetical protein ABK040_008980 [Willaertia magna]